MILTEVIPMKKHRGMIAFCAVFICVFMFPMTASANSSWHWLSSKKPYELLFIIAPLTIAAESAAIDHIPKIRKPAKVIGIVGAANLASFFAPYAAIILNALLYSPEIDIEWELTYTIDYMPYYTVGVFFLIVTLCVELPIVYFSLRKDCQKRHLLLITVIVSNIITTALCALAERLLCHGAW